MNTERVLYAFVGALVLAGALVPAASTISLPPSLLGADAPVAPLDTAPIVDQVRQSTTVIDPLTGAPVTADQQVLGNNMFDPSSILNPGAGPQEDVGKGVGFGGAPVAQFIKALGSPDYADLGGFNRAVMEYFSASGYGLPGPAFGKMDENDTLTFTYSTGDMNGDGVDDVIFNSYCTEEGCPGNMKSNVQQNPQNAVNDMDSTGQMPCRHPWTFDSAAFPLGSFGVEQGTPSNPTQGPTTRVQWKQMMFAISGFNGSVEWQRNMSVLDYNLVGDADPQGPGNPDPANPGAPGQIGWARRQIGDYILDGLCPVEFVVGGIPDGQGGLNPLVYRFTMWPRARCFPPPFDCAPPTTTTYPPYNWMGASSIIWHDIYAVNRLTGKVIWNHHENGTYEGTGGTAHADNLFLNPMIMVPPTAGVDLLKNTTESGLFLQRVSFDAEIVVGPAPPGGISGDTVLDSFQPTENIVRLDFNKGTVIYDRPSFGPDLPESQDPRAPDGDGHQSVLPWIINLHQFIPPFITVDPIHHGFLPIQRGFTDNSYWNYKPCCFDLTGDNFPDITYTTFEWSTTPVQNENGPWLLASKMRAFDGKTGDILWADDTKLEPGDLDDWSKRCARDEFNCFFEPSALRPWTELIGDANGDGKDDVLVHMEYRHEDYNHTVNVYSGADGKALWTENYYRARTIFTLPLGDSDGDGGNDLAVFEWEDWEYPDRTGYHFSNISVVPIAVLNGANGTRLWSTVTKTFNAPIDLLYMFLSLKVNGLPDVNGDGVGDLLVDDPLYLPDLEVVHRLTYVDGRNGKAIQVPGKGDYKLHAIGQFTMPFFMGDLTNDTIDDFGLMNGDIVDLWLTAYDGHNGSALWSRRVLTPRVSDYVFAIPRLRMHQLSNGNQSGESVLLNMQLEVYVSSPFPPPTFMDRFMYWYNASGNMSWGVPTPIGLYGNSLIDGLTTGTQSYENALEIVTKPTGATVTAKEIAAGAAPWAGLFGLAFLSSLPIAKFQPWRLKKGG